MFDILFIGALFVLSSTPKKLWIRISCASIGLLFSISAIIVSNGLKKAEDDAMLNSFHILGSWLDNGEDKKVLNAISYFSNHYEHKKSFSGMSFEKMLIGCEAEFSDKNRGEDNRILDQSVTDDQSPSK